MLNSEQDPNELLDAIYKKKIPFYKRLFFCLFRKNKI